MVDQPDGSNPVNGSTQAPAASGSSQTDAAGTSATSTGTAGADSPAANTADTRAPGDEAADPNQTAGNASGGAGAKQTEHNDNGAGPKQAAGNDNGGAGPKQTGASSEPAFEYENGNDKKDDFNLRPLPDRHFPIPEDQRKISSEVYEIRNVLKLLREHKSSVFPPVIDPAVYNEFIVRALQAGRVGCVATYVHPILASGALVQIRADIVRRVGVPLVYTYLAALAGWALVGLALGIGASAAVGAIAAALGHTASQAISGYDWLLLAAMAGAWFSVAERRREVGFDNIPLYFSRVIESAVRMLFVVVVAAAFALFLYLHFLTINVGGIHFNDFDKSIGVALFAGFIAGISERALSAQLIGDARKAFPGAKASTET
jgi:hypothetical protein